tara:strand:+ start:288 stop:821 length:534 start_codon:yes stop_codon:yes gene_type:complete
MDILWTENNRAQRGLDSVITYDTEELKPYGPVLVAQSDKGICFVGLPVEGSFETAIKAMLAYFPLAKFIETKSHSHRTGLDIQGTAMQIAVWKELLKIPEGETKTYKDIAEAINKPTAYRAVGNAVGANPVCIYIPCHRVVGSNGNLHGFAWGTLWKQKLLSDEADKRPCNTKSVTA